MKSKQLCKSLTQNTDVNYRVITIENKIYVDIINERLDQSAASNRCIYYLLEREVFVYFCLFILNIYILLTKGTR